MIIGISGKLGSGKDAVGKIIQLLCKNSPKREIIDFVKNDLTVLESNWENKKFADTLKDFICMLLGCTREKLEDRDFKEGILPEEWWYYKLGDGTILPRGYYPNESDNQMCEKRYLVKTTPRLLLQLMGTECGRDILHPNIWVNAVMSNYKPEKSNLAYNIVHSKSISESYRKSLPNWIITDMRFPNELEAVKQKGITIRVNRPKYENEGIYKYEFVNGQHIWYDNKEFGWVCTSNDSTKERSFKAFMEYVNEGIHPSETSLDNAEFNYIITNDSTIEDLVDKVEKILIKEKLL